MRFSKYDFGSVFGSVLGKTAVFGLVFGFLKNRGYRFGFRFLPCDALRCTVFVILILSVCLSHSWTVSTRFDLRS